MLKIEIQPEAANEVDVSVEWYLQQNTEIANNFLSAFKDALQSIASDPERLAKIDSQHHCYNLSKFPFQIIYRFKNDVIQVIAVAHCSRRPGYWSDRL